MSEDSGQHHLNGVTPGGQPDTETSIDNIDDRVLRGRALRFVLVNELMGQTSKTVAELVTATRRYGFRLGGRASKVISDALRWEVRRGRVLRLSRGVYCYHRAPPSTARRIRLLAKRSLAWVVATTRTATPNAASRRQTPPPWDNWGSGPPDTPNPTHRLQPDAPSYDRF